MRRFEFTFDNGTTLHIKPPSLRAYYKEFRNAKTDPELFRAIAGICSNNDENIKFTEEKVIDTFSTDDFHRFMETFPKWINEERESDPN